MPKNILLLGEFSTGKSAFLNMLLGVQLLPEQLDSTNLPVVKIHPGKPGGIWLREPGQKNPRALESWSDIPEDWKEFDHAEVTVPGHPYLDKGLTFWDTPGINTTNSHHKQHLDDFLKSKGSSFLRVFYFVSGNLTSTSIEFLKKNRSLWDKMMIIVNIKEVMGERQSRQIETEVKKTVLTQVGNIPVELLYVGDACEEFNALSEKNREGLSDYNLMRKWSELQIELTGLLERHEEDGIGADIFDIILTFADMPESESEKLYKEDETASSYLKESAGKESSEMIQGDIRAESTLIDAEDLSLMIKAAKSLLKNKKPEEAIKLIREAAEQGYVEAQVELGNCYEKGFWGEENNKEAVKWYKKAAEQGYAEAQYAHGKCYEGYLWGIKENLKEAVTWYKKAADQGFSEAQLALGNCYKRGRGIGKDNVEAFKCYQKAANQGYAEAQYILGDCYSYGDIVSENRVEAFKWYQRAADQGYAEAQYRLGKYYKFGWGIDTDKDLARKWFTKASAQGLSDAKLALDQLR